MCVRVGTDVYISVRVSMYLRVRTCVNTCCVSKCACVGTCPRTHMYMYERVCAATKNRRGLVSSPSHTHSAPLYVHGVRNESPSQGRNQAPKHTTDPETHGRGATVVGKYVDATPTRQRRRMVRRSPGTTGPQRPLRNVITTLQKPRSRLLLRPKERPPETHRGRAQEKESRL